jgi:hypothetical protein
MHLFNIIIRIGRAPLNRALRTCYQLASSTVHHLTSHQLQRAHGIINSHDRYAKIQLSVGVFTFVGCMDAGAYLAGTSSTPFSRPWQSARTTS